MSFKENISPGQHAYLVPGEREASLSQIKSALEEIFEIKIATNPDYRESFYESLGVDEARALKEDQSRFAFAGGCKFFVISALSITREAQNALLKVFEEPTEGTYFFLAVPSLRHILPTLRSRARIIKPATSNLQPASQKEAEEFLAVPVEKRLALPFVKQMLEDKNRTSITSFLDALEDVLHGKIVTEKMNKEERDFFSELMKMKGYSGDRASSVKMLLEHVALTAPIINK